MDSDMEPIEQMAMFIYSIVVTDQKDAPIYSALPESKKFFWQRIAAHSWEIYWTAREARESR
jgi:hypothetical protein